jgi:hypothetical protein
MRWEKARPGSGSQKEVCLPSVVCRDRKRFQETPTFKPRRVREGSKGEAKT